MRSQVVLAVILAVAALASAGPVPGIHGDAGTPGDAGDSPAEATELPSSGTYNGTLAPPGDADWYVLKSPVDRSLCYQAVIDGQAYANATLSLTQGLAPAVTRPILPAHVLDLGIAAPTTSKVFLGLTPTQAVHDQGSAETSLGSYRFDLQAFRHDDLGPGDAGTGQDAGEAPATGIAVEDPCIGGDLEPEVDTADTFTFQAEEGELVAISLAQAASAPIRLSLVSPSGDTRATIQEGGFADVALDETGIWSVQASLFGTTDQQLEIDYMIGLTVNGPEPPPCRPGCATYTGVM